MGLGRMPEVIYRRDDGRCRTDEVLVGTSVIQAALSNGVEGIVDECGGSAMCAICHVYVENGPVEKLPPISSVEEAIVCTENLNPDVMVMKSAE